MEKTISELCKSLSRTNFMDVSEEAIVEYQDLIGHASVEENRELANDPALMESFYRIYGVAYGTVAAIKFYMMNSEHVVQMKLENANLKNDLDESREMWDKATKSETFWRNKADEYKGKLAEAKRDMEGTEKSLLEKDAEIIALKARMYDMSEAMAELIQKGKGKE